MPINYKKIRNNYYWIYRNFKAIAINNLLVKISPSYSKDTVNPLCFIFKPEKTHRGIKSYFEIDKMNNEIMTIKERSSYLKINEKTIYKHAKLGKLPGIKIGGMWRFKKEAINYLQF